MNRIAWMLVLLPLLAAWPVYADPAATPAAPHDRFEQTQIHREGSTALPATGPSASANSSSNNDFDLTRVTLSLATVIGLIFGLRWVSRKIFPTAARAANPAAVRVLARCPIAPRQSILLLQVGRRVLVVGDTGSNLSSLGQITDADEIATLITQSKSTPSGPRSFGSLFGKARKDYDDEPADESAALTAGNRDMPLETTPTPDDPSLKAAESELAGLSQRIRDLARELK